MKLKDKGIIYDKKYLAAKLGLKSYQLNALASKYGIEAFWTSNQVLPEEKRITLIKVYLAQKEKDDILNYIKQHEHANTSEFVKHCIKQVMRKERDIRKFDISDALLIG